MNLVVEESAEPLLPATSIDIPVEFPPPMLDGGLSQPAKRSRWNLFENGVTGLTIDIPQSKARPVLASAVAAIDTPGSRVRSNPSRWKTKEFYCYYAIFGCAFPYMIKVVVDLSKGK